MKNIITTTHQGQDYEIHAVTNGFEDFYVVKAGSDTPEHIDERSGLAGHVEAAIENHILGFD